MLFCIYLLATGYWDFWGTHIEVIPSSNPPTIDGAFYRKRAYNLFGNKTPTIIQHFVMTKFMTKTAEDGVRRAKKRSGGPFSSRTDRRDIYVEVHKVRGTSVLRRPERSGDDLEPWFQGTPRHTERKKSRSFDLLSFRSACGRWDLNPHDCNSHKILSLARLPVPTLPHLVLCFKHKTYHTWILHDCQSFFRNF